MVVAELLKSYSYSKTKCRKTSFVGRGFPDAPFAILMRHFYSLFSTFFRLNSLVLQGFLMLRNSSNKFYIVIKLVWLGQFSLVSLNSFATSAKLSWITERQRSKSEHCICFIIVIKLTSQNAYTILYNMKAPSLQSGLKPLQDLRPFQYLLLLPQLSAPLLSPHLALV